MADEQIELQPLISQQEAQQFQQRDAQQRQQENEPRPQLAEREANPDVLRRNLTQLEQKIQLVHDGYMWAHAAAYILWAVLFLFSVVTLVEFRGKVSLNCQGELGVSAWTMLVILATTAGTWACHEVFRVLMNKRRPRDRMFKVWATLYIILPPLLSVPVMLFSLVLSSLCDTTNHSAVNVRDQYACAYQCATSYPKSEATSM